MEEHIPSHKQPQYVKCDECTYTNKQKRRLWWDTKRIANSRENWNAICVTTQTRMKHDSMNTRKVTRIKNYWSVICATSQKRTQAWCRSTREVARRDRNWSVWCVAVSCQVGNRQAAPLMTDPLPVFWVLFQLDGENFLNIPVPLLLRFGSEGVLKKFSESQ